MKNSSIAAIKMETVYFSIPGEFVTNMARDWLYAEGRPYEKVLDFLLSVMEGTDMSRETLVTLAHEVLLGKRKFTGQTRDGSFRIVDDAADIIGLYPRYFANKPMIKETSADYDEDDEDDEDEELYERNISFLSERVVKTPVSGDYGWLRPDGEFFEVEWCEHNRWATEYIKKYYPNEKAEYGGDFLVEKGWILLHSPAQGRVLDPDVERATGKQREFLYDYFMERGRQKEANAIWALETGVI